MKDQNDNKTVDCFSTRHAVKQGERLVICLLYTSDAADE